MHVFVHFERNDNVPFSKRRPIDVSYTWMRAKFPMIMFHMSLVVSMRPIFAWKTKHKIASCQSLCGWMRLRTLLPLGPRRNNKRSVFPDKDALISDSHTGRLHFSLISSPLFHHTQTMLSNINGLRGVVRAVHWWNAQPRLCIPGKSFGALSGSPSTTLSRPRTDAESLQFLCQAWRGIGTTRWRRVSDLSTCSRQWRRMRCHQEMSVCVNWWRATISVSQYVDFIVNHGERKYGWLNVFFFWSPCAPPHYTDGATKATEHLTKVDHSKFKTPIAHPGWVILYICHWAKWTLKRHIWTHSRVEPTCKNVHVFACLWEKARTHAGTSRTCKLHSERPQRAGLNPKPPRCVVTALTIAPLWQEAGGEKGKMSASSFSEEQALCSKQLPIPKHAPLTGFESEKSWPHPNRFILKHFYKEILSITTMCCKTTWEPFPISPIHDNRVCEEQHVSWAWIWKPTRLWGPCQHAGGRRPPDSTFTRPFRRW